MENSAVFEGDLNLKATELRLGLPGTNEDERQTEPSVRNNKRSSPEIGEHGGSKARFEAKAQVVGWPPIRSYRKNSFQQKKTEGESGMFVKVSMDGAPYLRKIDIKVYNSYSELLNVLENMFKLTIGVYSEREGYKGSEYAPTYEDKDGDWMLLGDVPWEMFISTCKRLRIMKGSEAKGLTCGV